MKYPSNLNNLKLLALYSIVEDLNLLHIKFPLFMKFRESIRSRYNYEANALEFLEDFEQYDDDLASVSIWLGMITDNSSAVTHT